ncbi:DNA-directed RNA polymerase [Rhypophila decipiens]
MPGDNDIKIDVFKDLLYDAVREHGSESRLFTQSDLLDLNVIPDRDVLLLVKVVQALTADKLLVATREGSTLAWRWRSREEAKKYTSFPNDETMLVYTVIDEAGRDGIWNRTIKNKLKMHESLVKNAIKYLETKGFIEPMKNNVEHPNKKMYIKANLKPSERATGGPWFTDGELDTAFVEELQELVFDYIKTKSAYLSTHIPMSGGGGGGATRAPKKGVIRGAAPSTTAPGEDTTRGTKRSATEISNDSSPIMQNSALPPRSALSATPAPAHTSSRNARKVFLPLPAGYKQYPTVTEIAQLIDRAGVTNNTTLSEADIQQLVDVLVFDGRVEPIKVNGRKGYRVTRAVKQDTQSFSKRREINPDCVSGAPPIPNGLMEAPCGRCPVFDICVEGGPVSPSTCIYFPRWLGIEQAPPAVSKEVTAS